MPTPRSTTLLLTACMLLWLAAHVAPAWTWVFPSPGEVRFFEIDSYFHYRQVRTLAHHPFSRLDLGTSYPTGERSANLGGYDVLLAAVSLVAGQGRPSDPTVRRVLAWAPVVCGLGLLLGLHALGRRLRGTAMLAPWLLLLFPGPLLGYSMLGFADHHAFEAMLAVLTCLGVLRCIERETAGGSAGDGRDAEVVNPSPNRGRGAGWRPVVPDALPAVLLLLSWNGAVLYVLAVGAAFVVAMAAAGRDDDAVGRAWIRWSLGALCLYAPLWLLVPDALLSLALARLVVLGLTVPLIALTGLLSLGDRVRGRLAALLAAGAVLGLALAAVRHAAAELLTARGPLVSEDGPVTLPYVWAQYGLLAPLAAAAPLVAIRARWIRRNLGDPHVQRSSEARQDVALGAVTGFTLTWMLIWWGTTKCGYVLPPFVALLAAFTLARAWEAVPSVGPRVALAAAVLLPLWPLQAVLSPWPPQARLASLMLVNDDLVAATTWMRDHTPPLPCPLDAAARSRVTGQAGWYGVFIPWDFGHLVPALAERPTLFAGEVNAEAARILLETDEDAAAEMLAPAPPNPRQTRYVVLEARALAEFVPAEIVAAGYNPAGYRSAGVPPAFGPRYDRSLMARLYLDGAQGMRHFRRVWDSPGQRVLLYRMPRLAPSLSRVTLDLPRADADAVLAQAGAQVHATATDLWYGAVSRPTVRIFERVKGARLQGVSTPGVLVTATIPLSDGTTWEQSASADASGRFELVIPCPTEPVPGGDLHATMPCQLRSTDGTATVPITEAQVQQGEVVSVTLAPADARPKR